MAETTTAVADPFQERFDQLIAALTANAMKTQSSALDAEALKAIILETQRTARKEAKPENETHPGLSVYSYPEGDREKPREHILAHEVTYNGFSMRKAWETHHWRELELAAQVVPGSYTVLRTDGAPMTVDVTGERDANGTLTKVEIKFPVAREERHYIPPMSVVLYQLVHPDNPRVRFMEAMQMHLQQLMGAA